MDQKTINNIASDRGKVSSTTVATVESIADAFGMTSAQLLDAQKGGSSLYADLAEDLSSLIKNFLAAEPEGRKSILRTSQTEARIAQSSNQTIKPTQ